MCVLLLFNTSVNKSHPFRFRVKTSEIFGKKKRQEDTLHYRASEDKVKLEKNFGRDLRKSAEIFTHK
jgi:hypothetical protein